MLLHRESGSAEESWDLEGEDQGCVGPPCLPIGLYLLLSDPTFAHLCLRLKSSADPAH